MEMKVKHLGRQATKRFLQIQNEIKEICNKMGLPPVKGNSRLEDLNNIHFPKLEKLTKERDKYLEPVWRE